MILPPFLRLVPEDIPNLAQWAQPLIGVLNNYADRLNVIFRGNLGWENFSSEKQTVTCTSGVPQQITLQTMKLQPTIVLPCYSLGQQFTVAITSYGSTLQPIITVTNATNPTGAQQVTVRFLP